MAYSHPGGECTNHGNSVLRTCGGVEVANHVLERTVVRLFESRQRGDRHGYRFEVTRARGRFRRDAYELACGCLKLALVLRRFQRGRRGATRCQQQTTHRNAHDYALSLNSHYETL